MEIIKNIAVILGAILSLISLVTILIKAEKKAVRKMFDENTKELKKVNNAQNEQLQKMQEIVLKMEKQEEKRQADLEEKINIVQEFCKQSCRQFIKETYYRYEPIKKIPLYERKTVDSVYDMYHNSFKSNSYITLLYNEIIQWELINSTEEEARERMLEED